MQRAPAASPPRLIFTRAERARLVVLCGVIAALHAVGCGLTLYYATPCPSLAGLGFAAYVLGLRHAVDADHIAAIDDTVRYLLQRDKRSIAVGFFFSLGHSTIVLLMAIAAALAAATLKRELPALQQLGTVIGTAVSAAFLWLIGLLNLAILQDALTQWRALRAQRNGDIRCGRAPLTELLAPRGPFSRLCGNRWQNLIHSSWQMFPVGMLFGLGFDTASEIALIAMAAASGQTLPLPAVLALPVLFAAGMLVLDTTDGVLMVQAYSWALVDPLRKLFYNIVLTCLSVAVALFIGTAEGLQVLARVLNLHGRLVGMLNSLDYGFLGLLIVGLLLAAWGLSALVSRSRRHLARA